MSNRPRIRHFYNANPGSLGFEFKGIRYTLWDSGDIFLDSKGVPIVDELLCDSRYASIGLLPKYLDTGVLTPPPAATPVPTTAPVPPDSTPVPPTKAVSASVRAVSDITEVEKNTPEKLIVTLSEGIYTFALDNFSTESFPGMKTHIRNLFGKELLERVQFK